MTWQPPQFLLSTAALRALAALRDVTKFEADLTWLNVAIPGTLAGLLGLEQDQLHAVTAAAAAVVGSHNSGTNWVEEELLGKGIIRLLNTDRGACGAAKSSRCPGWKHTLCSTGVSPVT